MFKKVTTLLLVFILLVQLISPVMNVSADEGREDVDIVIDYDMEQIEIDEISEELLEVDEIEEELSEVEIAENDEEETSEIDEIAEELSELDEEVEEETIIEVLNTGQVLEQATIDAMYEFLANNSEQNPFIVPRGSSFDEVMNAMAWGEGVTVYLIGHRVGSGGGVVLFPPVDPYLFSGHIALYLNAENFQYGIPQSYDDVYWFRGTKNNFGLFSGVFVYYQYEGSANRVWTSEEIAFVRELENSLWVLFDEASSLAGYVYNMSRADLLSEHPNGAELYRLLDQFREFFITGFFFDITIPFDHEHNVNALARTNEAIAFIESFIAQVTAALDDEAENNNNSNQPTLPQTGTGVALNTMLAGSGLVALGGLTTYKKLKKNKNS